MNKLEKDSNYTNQTFEDLKHIDENGIEFWYARELMSILQYSNWQNFEKIIHKAMIACENSNISVIDHFTDVNKMVQIGSGAYREQIDYKLTRYACYLIAQNGDSRKKVIALAQTYFAVQTRKQEISEKEYSMLTEDEKRFYQRDLTRKGNYSLNQTAKKAEVTYKNKQLLVKKPKLYNLFWGTTLRCNAKCKHCGSRAGENCNFKDELTTQEIENALQSIANKYKANEILLNITGGEPLVRKDLFEVMNFAKNLGYHWGMTTNAMLINDDNIEKMKKTGMTTISISLDGLENSHDEFRGVKGSFSKIIENIRKLKEANFLNYLQVTTVVNKLNINELEELYTKMKELQIDSWRIVNMDPIGRAQDNKELALDKKDYKYLLDFVKEKKKKSKFDVTYGCTHFVSMKYEKEVRNHMFFCVTGFTTGSILYNGDIYVCPSVERRKELVQGNIRTDDFVYVWENKFKWFGDLDKLKCKECENCKDWKYCRGDSLDTWNFNNNRPKLCLSKILEGDVLK